MAEAQWEPAERVQQGGPGEYRALIGGEWVQVAKAQKGGEGEYRVQRMSESPQGLPEQPQENSALQSIKDTASTAADIARHPVTASAITGAAAGYAAPEILQKTGQALQKAKAVPYIGKFAGPAGTAMIASGQLIKEAKYGRVMSAVDGAVSNAVGEIGGQIADNLGHPWVGNAARIAGAALTPSVQSVSKFLTGNAKRGWNFLSGATHDAGETLAIAGEKVRERLASSGFRSIPEHTFNAWQQETAEAGRMAAEKAAAHALSEAHATAANIAQTDGAAAKRVVDAATIHGDTLKREAVKTARVLDAAADGKLKTATRVLALSEKELTHTVGHPVLPEDLGNAIRAKVTPEQQRLIAERKAQYEAVEKQRDAAVEAKRAQGFEIRDMPEAKALLQELSEKAVLTQKGAKGVLAKAEAAGVRPQREVSDAGVRAVYQRIYDALRSRRYQIGTAEDGTPQYETFETSFKAIDDIRRHLGEAFKKTGTPAAEGYGAISNKLQKDLYERIGKIQEDYAGPLQAQLQEGYREATVPLGMYKSPAGKRVVEMSPYTANAFASDAESVPRAFFKSQQSVRDLVAMTGGDVKAVGAAARSHAAYELHGKSQVQVKDWLKDNAQWVREVPGLEKDVVAYAGRLGQLEKAHSGLKGIATRQQELAKGVRKAGPEQAIVVAKGAREVEKTMLEQSVKRQEAVVKSAEGQGKALREAAETRVAKAKGNGFPSEVVKGFLLDGNREEMVQAMRAMAGTPGGKTAVEGSVRNVLRDMPAKKLAETWNGRLKEALTEARVLNPTQMAELHKQVQAVLDVYAPHEAKAKVSALVMSALRGAAGGAGGTAGAIMKKPED